MKKLFRLFAAACMIGTAGLYAQDVTFGAKAGLNLSNAGGDAEDTDMLTAFYVGGFADIALSDQFSVQPELLYSAQGFKQDFAGNEVETKLNYLNIPIMAKYYVTEELNVQAGPQVGILLSAEAADIDVKDATNGVDFGINFGLGYEMESGLRVDARFNLGLGDTTDDDDAGDTSVTNQVIQVGVGYAF